MDIQAIMSAVRSGLPIVVDGTEIEELKKALQLYDAFKKLEAWRKERPDSRRWDLGSIYPNVRIQSLAFRNDSNDMGMTGATLIELSDPIDAFISLAAEGQP